MTIIELLNAKVGAKLLSLSDKVSLASFMRKVAANLVMKVLVVDVSDEMDHEEDSEWGGINTITGAGNLLLLGDAESTRCRRLPDFA